jgi:hypothetical protein
MIDPYESSRIPQLVAEPEGSQSPPPSFMHITVSGCNILGVAAFTVFIAITSSFLGVENRLLRGTILVVSIVGFCAFDLIMRLSVSNVGRVARFLSTRAGGAMLFVPMWIMFLTALTIAVLGIAHSR